MSSPGHDAPGVHNLSTEEGVDMKKVVMVGVVSLAIFALSALIAWFILRADVAHLEQTRGRPSIPTELGKDEIGIVDQPDFSADHRLEQWKAAKQKRLSSYGWSGPGHKLIHIPIDRAMDEVISREAAAVPGGR
jgi:hypothetical protein